MLGQLVSMRDEEVLHTVHGRICLCWCVLFLLLSRPIFFFQRKEGRSVVKAPLLLPYVQRQDHRHSCAAEAITGKKQKEGIDMSQGRQRKKVTVRPLSLLSVSSFCQGSQPLRTVNRMGKKTRTQIQSRHNKTDISRLPSILSIPPLFSSS